MYLNINELYGKITIFKVFAGLNFNEIDVAI